MEAGAARRRRRALPCARILPAAGGAFGKRVTPVHMRAIVEALALSAAEAAEHGARGRADRVGREHTEGSNEPRRKRKLDEGSSGGLPEQRGFQQRTDTPSTRRGKGSSHVRKGKALFIDEEYASETYGRGGARAAPRRGHRLRAATRRRGARHQMGDGAPLADGPSCACCSAPHGRPRAVLARRVDPEENDHQPVPPPRARGAGALRGGAHRLQAEHAADGVRDEVAAARAEGGCACFVGI